MSVGVARAAAEGDVKTVNKWLTARGYTRQGQLVPVITQAVLHGHDNICQLLLDCDAINTNEDVMNVAFATACETNQLTIAKRLIQHCSTQTSNFTAALLKASVKGQFCIVKWLISDVMHLSLQDRIRWMLATACVRSELSDIQELAMHVLSDVTSVMSQALRVACNSGRRDIVMWLTSHTTADVSSAAMTRSKDGEMTSLMEACERGHDRVAIQLLQCVTPHTVNMMSGRYRDTALRLTCFSETDMRLYTACDDGDVDAVNDLLYKSNVDLQDNFGLTPLHLACINGHIEIARSLLSVFARTDITNNNRRTPAMMAQLCGFTELESYLRRTLTASRDNDSITTRVTNNNTDTVSISLSSTEDAQHNNNKSHKLHQVIKFTSTNKRQIV